MIDCDKLCTFLTFLPSTGGSWSWWVWADWSRSLPCRYLRSKYWAILAAATDIWSSSNFWKNKAASDWCLPLWGPWNHQCIHDRGPDPAEAATFEIFWAPFEHLLNLARSKFGVFNMPMSWFCCEVTWAHLAWCPTVFTLKFLDFFAGIDVGCCWCHASFQGTRDCANGIAHRFHEYTPDAYSLQN